MKEDKVYLIRIYKRKDPFGGEVVMKSSTEISVKKKKEVFQKQKKDKRKKKKKKDSEFVSLRRKSY